MSSFPPPAAPLVHFFSFFNQSSRLRPHPPSPSRSSLHRSVPSAPPSISDRCLILLAGLSLILSPCERTVEVGPLVLLPCADGSLQHFFLFVCLFWECFGEESICCCQSTRRQLCLCSFCTPFLGPFRDCAFPYLSPHCR